MADNDPARAQSSGYSGPTYTDGTYTNYATHPFYMASANFPLVYAYGAATGTQVPAGPGTTGVTYSCAGPVKATFTWPSNAGPLPQSVIVEEQAEAEWKGNTGCTGSANNPLGGVSSGNGVDWAATKYLVQNSPASPLVIEIDGLASSATTPAPDVGGGIIACQASCQVSAFPVTISLSGATLVNGAYDALTGQQITASISGLPTGSVIKSYQWGYSGGNPIETWDPNAPGDGMPTQLIPLSSQNETASTFEFYDEGTGDQVTVKCMATVTLPDGSAASVTAESLPVTFLKPTATWTIQAGTIQKFTLSNSPGNTFWGIYPDSSAKQYGMNWSSINFTMPSGFPLSGSGAFTQLWTPNRTVTQSGKTTSITAPGFTDGTQGLDTAPEFMEWSLPATGSGGDDPALGLNNNLVTGYTGSTGDGLAADTDSYTTWLMYQPPGTNSIWVPVRSYTWIFNCFISWNGTSWSYGGFDPTPDENYNSSTTDTPPSWTFVQHGINYTP